MPVFHICFGCGCSLGVKLTPCHKCHAVYFCGAECMRNAAAGHSAFCARVAGLTTLYIVMHKWLSLVSAETLMKSLLKCYWRYGQWRGRYLTVVIRVMILCCLAVSSWQSVHDKGSQLTAGTRHYKGSQLSASRLHYKGSQLIAKTLHSYSSVRLRRGVSSGSSLKVNTSLPAL